MTFAAVGKFSCPLTVKTQLAFVFALEPSDVFILGDADFKLCRTETRRFYIRIDTFFGSARMRDQSHTHPLF